MPKLATKLSSKLPALAKSVKAVTAIREPLWKGPCDTGPMGGVTQSLLGRTLVCKERARLYLIDGYKPHDTFSHRMEYGSMWHVCEEALAKHGPSEFNVWDAQKGNKSWRPFWETELKKYAQSLVAKYRESGTEINKYYQVCLTQFPIYVKHWAKHPDVKNRKPVFQEETFNVPYRLPSGRVVRLRGKFDAVDIIDKGLYLQENKTKSEIDIPKIQRELPWDLQTNLYLTALNLLWEEEKRLTKQRVPDSWVRKEGVKGVRYNVVKRPLSGRGAGNIRQREGRGNAKAGAETDAEFYARLGGVIEEAPKEFFQRFKMDLTPEELKRFQDQCLNPILENTIDDYEWWVECHKPDSYSVFDYHTRKRLFPHHQNRHFTYPTGIYNPALEGRVGDYDEFILNGSTNGLDRVTTMFGELQ